MPEAAFVISARHDEAVRELAETLADELVRQDVAASVHVGSFPAAREGLVYVLIDPGDFAALEGEDSLPDDAVLRRTIFVSREPPPRDRDDPRLRLLRRAGTVFVTDQLAVAATHRLGVPGRLLRAGYSPMRDRYDRDAARPIDVMFMGKSSPRRLDALRRMAPMLARHNCLISVSPDGPISGPTASYLGSSRWPLLAQTKIVVLIHRLDERERFDWDGAVDAIHAGAVVVSEHASGVGPLVAGEHLLVSSIASMGFIVDGLLNDDARLASLRESAYERLSGWIPYALPVSTLRAAIVELVGEPLPESSNSKRTGRGLLSRGLASLQPSGSRRVDGAADAGAAAPRPAGDRSIAGTAASVEIHRRSVAWTAFRSQRLSVLMHATGPADRVEASLASLAAGDWREYELVVVVEEEEPDVVRAVKSWSDDHPRVPCLELFARGATVGTARNAALAFARGELCLFLDPGQELYPRGLGRLVATLSGMGDMAFAYPIVEVSGDPDGFSAAGGEPLLGYLGWDPGSFGHRDPIFAPFVARTAALRELGGFTDDRRLAGFEDWDLWCRMADRGWRGQLASQILARRPGSRGAPELSRMRPAVRPVLDGLREHAPSLFAPQG